MFLNNLWVLTMQSKKETQHIRAVGLTYDGSGAPVLSIKGAYVNADAIVSIARRHGIPIVEKSDLVRVLECVEIDEEIPTELYEAVATILHQIDRG